MNDDIHEQDEFDVYQRFNVLDKGFVRLVDYMGDDMAIVQAARVSYGSGSKGQEQDRRLIDYLMRNRHTSPFEMCELKFHIKAPIFVARQWVRHRTASWNEISGRYTELKDEFYIPDILRLNLQHATNKQGSDEHRTIKRDHIDKVLHNMEHDQNVLTDSYHGYLDAGLAKEVARINLPLSLYTEWYWKIDLHNLLHFLKLRMDSHAQWEIRQYAEVIGNNIVAHLFPWTWESFYNHVLNAVTFSALEIELLRMNIVPKRSQYVPDGMMDVYKNMIKKLGLEDES